ncbi:hypothetical protein [Parasphingorhabdus sp.]|uniref:hypothetical protein n=1 Tax=Parasphingorhabdus sp. TaxID=2709688 RepID=UPI0030028211
MTRFAIPRLLKTSLAASTLLALGGCMYGSGGGYYGDGYVNNSGYDCDPYAPFNDYYACDYGYGFANIGYGGGWYDQYYYPGYGTYVFDRGGKRHGMRDHHRRYWAKQRAEYGGHHRRGRQWDRDRRGRGDGWRGDRRGERGEDRADRRERWDGARDQRRGDYRGNPRSRGDLGTRPGTRERRPDRAAPGRTRGDRAARPERRPSAVANPAQARLQPAARPAPVSRPVRSEGPRVSPRTNRADRQHVRDD